MGGAFDSRSAHSPEHQAMKKPCEDASPISTKRAQLSNRLSCVKSKTTWVGVNGLSLRAGRERCHTGTWITFLQCSLPGIIHVAASEEHENRRVFPFLVKALSLTITTAATADKP